MHHLGIVTLIDLFLFLFLSLWGRGGEKSVVEVGLEVWHEEILLPYVCSQVGAVINSHYSSRIGQWQPPLKKQTNYQDWCHLHDTIHECAMRSHARWLYSRRCHLKVFHSMCMFDNFHLTVNFRSRVSRDVFKNRKWMSTDTYIFS